MTLKPFWVFDYQVNGALGIDFSQPDLSVDQVLKVTEWLARQGIAYYFPCIVTCPLDILERNLSIIRKAMQVREGGWRILGIHLEGPVISRENGPRGAHPAEHVLNSLDADQWNRLRDAAEGAIKLVTVAPECDGAVNLIRMLRADGVHVGLGHTDAGMSQFAEAVGAGAELATHFGNGCGRKYGEVPQLMRRHDNPMWAALGNDKLALGIIADGHHLPPEILLPVHRTKGALHVLYTTDLAPVAGLDPGKYTEFGSINVELHANGLVTLPDSPNLAGSAVTPLQQMNMLWWSRRLVGITRPDQIVLGWHNALKLFGLIISRSGSKLPGPRFTFSKDDGFSLTG